jgi:hypothetical protein
MLRALAAAGTVRGTRAGILTRHRPPIGNLARYETNDGSRRGNDSMSSLVDRWWVVLIVALAGCSSEQRSLFDSGSASAGSTDSDGIGDGGPASDGTASTSGGDANDDDGVIFDVGNVTDLPGGPGVMPKCGDLGALGPTSVGCEFWAVRVPVYSDPLTPRSYGVGVGNPFDHEVVVTFEDLRGPGNTLREVGQTVLGPRESRLVALNGPNSLLPGEDHEIASQGLSAKRAFRITSDEPITAMQINPIGGAPSYVPEASMLLPTNALGDVYYGIGYEKYGADIPDFPFPIPGADFGGWVAVVAIEDGTTITTSDGQQTIDAFDVWTYAPDDPTGYFVSTNKRVAVFSGTTCSNIPSDTGWCDHVEEQLIPVAAWGTHYVGARHPHRIPEHNPSIETVYWRVIAAKDDTVIQLTPPVHGATVTLAKAGDYVTFDTTQSFVAETDDDHPFMLVQYMGGGAAVANVEGCGGSSPATGDPYMLQMVPTAQWLEELPFLTDTSYARDFVTIVRPTGATVDLQCMGVVPDARFTAIAGTDYEVANVYLDIDGNGGEGNCVDGQQFISASEPVGIAVGGFDCAASYGYPGGLSLDELWVPPHTPPG